MQTTKIDKKKVQLTSSPKKSHPNNAAKSGVVKPANERNVAV